MHPQANPERLRLASRLREVRAATGLSGNRFAAELGWVQSRVSRMETGLQIPTDDDLAAWVAVAGANDEAANELADLARLARVEYATFRDSYRRSGGAAGYQAKIGQQEMQAKRICMFVPTMMPGPVQTAPYAREMLSLSTGPKAHGATSAEIEAMVTERIRRQDVLYASDVETQFVIGEAALRTRFGSVDTQLGQLDRLAAIAGLHAVELGVLPFAAQMPAFPLATFTLHDNAVVLSETITGEQRIDEPGEVAVYVKAFAELRQAAVRGDEAVALTQQIAAEIRGR